MHLCVCMGYILAANIYTTKKMSFFFFFLLQVWMEFVPLDIYNCYVSDSLSIN